jgi:hypothetical protein
MPVRCALLQWYVSRIFHVLELITYETAELRVHFDPTLWKEYPDTAKEHPMSSVISEIIQVFKKLGSSTLVMPASIVTSAEVSFPK